MNVRVILGLALIVGGVGWLVWLMMSPVLTYDIMYGDVVELRCESVHGANEGHIVTTASAPVEIVTGSAFVKDPDGNGGTWLGPEVEGDDPNILGISRAQLTADCASARVERQKIAWLPTLGAAAGLFLCLGSWRRSASAVT